MSHFATPITDVEFADDTTKFLHASAENLNRLHDALQVFCNAAGSKLNWNKSVGFGLVRQNLYEGQINIFDGEPYTYLGCQVGVDLKPELQIAPLLSKLR